VSFDIATLSRTAGRTANEDYADFLQTDAVGCWVIADGLGGHRGGATASKAVVEAALDSFRMMPDVSAEAVTTHIARAQEALLEAQRREPALSQMRSTIVVLISGDREAVWGHVGDSRLYHLRGGQVIARTRDHSVGQALVDGGQIDAAAQGSHEDRSRLLRCLGKDGDGGATVGGPQPLARGDVFLLCTDGFWEALDDVAITLDLVASEDAAAWLDRLEARLRRRIGPSHDNYTATAIRVLNAATPLPAPHDPRAPAHSAARTEDLAVAQTPPGGSRATRIALAAAGVLLAIALIATGMWQRHVISAWVRSLMSPASVTPAKEPPAKDRPLDPKPDAKADTPKRDPAKPDTPKPATAKPDDSKASGAPINEGKPRPRTPPRPPGDQR
jgi:serine/threonine protein phosphatase PrpC